jgi:PAS domain S-box-containing protein
MISDRLTFLRSAYRLEAVRRTGLLEGSLPGEFDRLLHLSCRCVPARASAFLLLGGDGFHCLGSSGLPPTLAGLAVWPLEWPYLMEAAFEGPLFVSGSEPRASDGGVPKTSPEPFPGTDFPAFAGIPLSDRDGNCLGIFCMWDDKSRMWRKAREELIAEFAGAVQDLLARRLEVRKHEEERKDTEEKTRATDRVLQSRDEMEVILRAMDEPIIARDAAGKLIFANDGAVRRMGFANAEDLLSAKPEEIGARFEVFDEAGNPVDARRYPSWQTLGSKAEAGSLMRYRVKATGEEFWVVVKSRPVFDAAGNVRLVISVLHDITAIKQAELDLARSRDELGVILRTIQSAVMAFDPEGRILYANPSAARMLDFSDMDELLRSPKAAVLEKYEILDEALAPFPPGRLPAVRALAGETDAESVMCYRVKATGEVKWSLVRAAPIFDSQGKVRVAISVFNDITPMKKAERELARSRDELSAILRTMENALTARDGQGNLIYANDAAARLLGFASSEELLRAAAKGDAERFEALDEHGNPFPAERLPERRALRGEAVSGVVIGHRARAAGKERWSLVNAAPVHDDLGNVRMAVVISQDITERREAEEGQRKHMRYLEAVDAVSRALEKAQEGDRHLPEALGRMLEVLDASRVWLIHPADPQAPEFRAPFAAARGEGNFSGTLPGGMPVREMLGDALASDEPVVYLPGSASSRLSGRPLPDGPFWRDAFGADKVLAAVMRPQLGRPWMCCLARAADGAPWAEEDVILFKDIVSRLAGALGGMILYRDLRRSEENYRTLFERSLDGIYRCAPDGVVLDANPALIAMLGYADRSGLVGSVQTRLLPAGGAVEGLPDRSEAFSVELKRKDGGSLWVEVNSQAIRRADGELAYFEGMVRNINDRKRTEEALKSSEEKLRQSQKMEAVGRLAGGVAHDFNNLLTAINGFSDLLLMSVPQGDARRGHVEEIRKAGERAASLTGQLLAFSRKQVLAPRILDLNAVVSGMQTMLTRLIGENIDFKIRPAPDVGRVLADPGQVEQIILNLALNSRDAMPEGGELVISTEKVRLEPEVTHTLLEVPPGDYLVLSVRDTGMGMNEETKARLFEPFFTTKSKDKGTGLGLSMVYGAVKHANGTLAVESEPGRGTVFRVYLPAAAPGDEAKEPARRSGKIPAVSKGSETILLVEDEDAVRRLVRDVLQANGYKVFDAPGGEKALELAAAFQGGIHLLLTDVVMGGMSGRELAERLTKARPSTKVLFMSGYTEDAILRHGVMAAQTAFIGKPFTPAALAAKVREVLGVTAK